MSLTKADERWLACLDRAIDLQHTFPRVSEGVVDLANLFYAALNRAVRGKQ